MKISSTKPHNHSEYFAIGLAGLGVLLCILSLVLFQKQFLINKITEHISIEGERRIGEEIIGNIEIKKISNENINKLLSDLTNIIASDQYHFILNDNDEINAFALPGGYIIINTGLIFAAESAEEILGVVAHEMAHIKQRHVLKNMINAFGIYTLLGLISNAEGVFSVIAANSGTLLNLQYSRKLEAEADDVALEILKSAGLSPYGLRDFFMRIQNSEAETPIKIIDTHPLLDERIDNINTRTQHENNYIPITYDVPALKSAIAKLQSSTNK